MHNAILDIRADFTQIDIDDYIMWGLVQIVILWG